MSANPAGLGRLTVLSTFGEPFHAEAELISGSESEAPSLTARLASPETYRSFNLPYGTARAGLLVSVEERPTGQRFIRIASGQYIHEPVLPLLIELEWSEGLLVRKYTALLDLPALDPPPATHPAAPPAAPERRTAQPGPVARAEPARERSPARVAAPAAKREAPPVAKAPDAPAVAAGVARAPVKEVPRPPAKAPSPGAVDGGSPEELEARARALEQEAAAGEKALTATRDRIEQLEKTIRDMQRLAEAGQSAPVAATEQESAKPSTVAQSPAPAKPRSAVVAPPAEPSQSGTINTVLDNLPLVGGGAVALLLGVLLLARRRRGEPAANDEAAATDAAEMQTAEPDHAPPPKAGRADESGQMDPIEEAGVFISYGREAQAVQLLEGAVAESPARADVWLKLLEICSARKDKDAFGKHARAFSELTGGRGENWLKVAAMGYGLDPDNTLYEAGKGVAVPEAAPAAQEHLDFGSQRDPEPADHAPVDVETIAEPPADGETALDIEVVAPAAGDTSPDFSIEVPDAGVPATDLELDAEEPPVKSTDDFPAMDFNIELPKSDEAPAPAKPSEDVVENNDKDKEAIEEKEPETAKDAEPVPELKLDLSGINLELGAEGKTDAAPDAEGKDPHWQDVQEKFELVRAYQVLGADTESQIEILQEIVKDGDAQQRAEARKAIDRLSKKDE